MLETARTPTATPPKENGNERLKWLRDRGFIYILEFKDERGKVVDTAEAVNYWGLLTLAHEEGLKRVHTQHVQLPSKENDSTAVFWAEVETKRGTFKKHGDANPKNANARMQKHLIPLAETRAIARAFRDALDIGLVCAEELDVELDPEELTRKLAATKTGGNGQRPPEAFKNDPPSAAAAAPVKPKSPQGQQGGNGAKPKIEERRTTDARQNQERAGSPQTPSYPPGDERMTDRQRSFLFRLAGDLGYQGQEAHDYLKGLFKVESLKQVTKEMAKEGIEFLLKKVELLETESKEKELPF